MNFARCRAKGDVMYQSVSSIRISSRVFPFLAVVAIAACSGNNGTMSSSMSSSSATGSGTGTASGPVTAVSPYPAASTPTDHVTFQHDMGRTGLNPTESILTPANVNSSSFGLQRNLMVDGRVDAQPLYLSQLSVGGAQHNTVFVATENGSVYAFDADSGTQLWQVSMVPAQETPSDDHGCGQITPSIGVTATPVIDRQAGEMFLVAMTKDSTGAYHQRLHALDITTGAEIKGSPTEISASYKFGNTTTTFDPGLYAERAALLLSGGTIYTAWTSHCDVGAYYGWVMAFSETTLQQTGVLNVAASANIGSAGHGSAVWMTGDGPGADADGNVYLLTANGAFETTLTGAFPSGGDYGNSIMKISSAATGLKVADYFTSSDTLQLSSADEDLGSGGEIVLPDVKDATGTVRHLVVGAGKQHVIYVADRDAMGGFNMGSNNVYQAVPSAISGSVFSTPAFFNSTLYYCANGDKCSAIPMTNAMFATAPSSVSSGTFPYPGATPAISANGTSNAILWAHEQANPAVLHAYDATDLSKELYNSSQAANGRDQFGAGNKFIAPAIADGRVFVGTTNSVAVFGLVKAAQ